MNWRKESNCVLDSGSIGHCAYVVSSAPDNSVIELLLSPSYRGGKHGLEQSHNQLSGTLLVCV